MTQNDSFVVVGIEQNKMTVFSEGPRDLATGMSHTRCSTVLVLMTGDRVSSLPK